MSLALSGRTTRLAILCGISFGIKPSILFCLGLFILARIYPKKSKFPPVTSLDILKGVSAWVGSMLLCNISIVGGLKLLIDDRDAVIQFFQTAGYLTGLVATLVLYYYLYGKRLMSRKHLIKAKERDNSGIQKKKELPSAHA